MRVEQALCLGHHLGTLVFHRLVEPGDCIRLELFDAITKGFDAVVHGVPVDDVRLGRVLRLGRLLR